MQKFGFSCNLTNRMIKRIAYNCVYRIQFDNGIFGIKINMNTTRRNKIVNVEHAEMVAYNN